ncbi:MAG: NahK/ErcS family hybrid sensor histidine kinase/response regulator [Motiliproteus sp.]
MAVRIMTPERQADVAAPAQSTPDLSPLQLPQSQPPSEQPTLQQLQLLQQQLQQLQQQLDQARAENVKLGKINRALMQRVESGPSRHEGAYGSFEHAVFLAEQVREQTLALNRALEEIKHSNQALKQANTQAQTAHSNLQDAIESISDAFVLYGNDRRLLLANSTFKQFWQASGVDIRPGVHYEEIMALAKKERMIERYYGAGVAVGAKTSPLGDGKVFRMRGGGWLQVSQRKTGDGGLVVLYKDITALIENERALRERALANKSRVLQHTLDNLSQSVVLVNAHNQLETWNQRFRELIGKSTTVLKQGDSFTQLMALSEVSDLNPCSRDLEGKLCTRLEQKLSDGRILEICSHALPSGEFVNTYTDITERSRSAEALVQAYQHMEQRVAERTAELTQVNRLLLQEVDERRLIGSRLLEAKKEAEQANQSKTKFLAAASHDLLQPMNAARLFSASLLEHPLQDKTRALVQSLNYSLEDVESLLAALVDISKLDAGVVKPDITAFSADHLLGNLANEFQTLAAQSQLDFHWVPCRAVIATDSQLLARILRNFLSNALRYTRKGRIVLGCRRNADGVSIQVWDTGIGIAADKQREIFQEFNRVQHDNSAHDKGLGLGLAIVDKMSGILGHRVSVQSTPGSGSCFSVQVPYGELDQSQLQRSPAQSAQGQSVSCPQLQGRRILVLDNERSICQAMQLFLEGWGCEVLTALSYSAIVEQSARLGALDLIVADYHLDNNQTGLDAVQRMTQELGISAPVLMITANYSNDLKQEIRALGYQLMNKPVRPAKLKAVIQHLVNPPGGQAGG